MLSRVQPLQQSSLYIAKKSKEPDHLYLLIKKNKEKQMTSSMVTDDQVKQRIQKQIIKKRVEAIVKNDKSKPKVSDPVPFVKKKWVSPLSQLQENQSFNPYLQKKSVKVAVSEEQKEEIQKVVAVLDLNKRLKYFGEYLQVDLQAVQQKAASKKVERDSKIRYLTIRFQELQKQVRPKLCIMNFPAQQKATFINYLEPDQCYQDIIRKNDIQLAQMLIEALCINGRFIIDSYIKFYDIFVWQTANKKEQMEFVGKLLMKELKEQSIVEIARVIDNICNKIRIQQFNRSLQNFNQVMKKLIFGDDYENAERREYYLTRKALMESLEGNEECISIFINIFYTS